MGERLGLVRALRASLLPLALLLGGVVLEAAARPERSLAPNAPLEAFPSRLLEWSAAESRQLDESVLRVLRPDAYVHRLYTDPEGRELALFIAYYGRQLSGATIHSPRNCLPGAGWEPVRHRRIGVASPYGEGTVNRYLIEHQSGARALVFYWYQGRGRVEANEYVVKWDLLRDAVLKRRSDEALVRLVFPLPARGDAAPEAGRSAVEEVIRRLEPHLPA